MSKPWVELWLEIETRCNLACRFCYNYWKDGSAPEPSRTSTADLISAMESLLSAVDCRRLAFSGGEPLLRSDLAEILLAVRPYRIPSVLTTNGVLLTEQRISELRAAGLENFQVSLHSHREDVHDRLSGGRCWRKAVEAILAVKESGASIVPVFVATNWNLGDFPAVVGICAKLGLQHVIFNRFVPSGLGNIHRDTIGLPTTATLLAVVTEANAEAERHGIHIQLGVPIDVPAAVRDSLPCIDWASCPVASGQRRWTIGSDLSIRRCNHSPVNIGRLMAGGIEALINELEAPAARASAPPSGIHACRILAGAPLVQIRSVG
ncbi:MAG: radical SAM protein, partial [Bryobacteraceae bacterium]